MNNEQILTLKDIHPFIFNWNNQFEKTCAIEKELQKYFKNITVINSDDSNSKEGWVNLGNDAFFGDQFKKALELFNGKVLMHIQGDVEYNNWKGVIDNAIKNYNIYKWSLYAPNIDYTYWSDYVNIDGMKFDDKNLKLCTCLDETVWFLHKDVIDEFFKRKLFSFFDGNKIGWGYDLVFCSLSFLMKRFVIRDYEHTIVHPKIRNYDEKIAEEGFAKLLQNISEDLKKIVFYIINNQHKKIFEYFIPELMPYQFDPFNNDTFVQNEFINLKNNHKITIAIETGSCFGGTTEFLANNFDDVYTIEINDKHRDIMLYRCKDYKNINSFLGDSSVILEDILKKINDNSNVIFFLDAHWNNYCPLEKELDTIAKFKNKFNNLIITIHDFKVPKEDLGFYSYNKQDFTFEWLKPKFDLIYDGNYLYYYNSFDKSTDIKRGIIYLINHDER
jgi:hypothetical protein